jgi:MOSC domain-containing protein YiiM
MPEIRSGRQSQLGRSDFTYGQFGENLTIDGLSDQEVCIGDRYRGGSALFEVTQPRVTCYRVGIRMNEPQMAALLVAHGRPGFYFRVLEERRRRHQRRTLLARPRRQGKRFGQGRGSASRWKT